MTAISRMIRTGAYSVTPICDGFFPIGVDLIPKADSSEGMRLLQASGKPTEGPSLEPVNCYLVKYEERAFLIDAGCGNVFGPELGATVEVLRTCNVETKDIEMIMLTHMHPDHIGGLLTSEGKARYENAQIVVQQAEIEYWSSLEMQASATPMSAPWFDLVRNVLEVYAGRIRGIDGNIDLLPGMRTKQLIGHTPGHMGILFHEGESPLLVWGDIVHCALLQLAQPDWAILFDVDALQAAETRKKVLEELTSNRMNVAGMHLTGVGKIYREESGYSFGIN